MSKELETNKRDQAWAGLRKHYDDLARIADYGISEPSDIVLVRRVCSMAVGELAYRELEVQGKVENE